MTVTATDLLAGAAGGIGGGLGLICFYPALAAGPMSIVAPTTAVCSAIVPLVVRLATGDRPSVLALVGLVLALPAVVLVPGSRARTGGPRPGSSPCRWRPASGSAVLHRPRRRVARRRDVAAGRGPGRVDDRRGLAASSPARAAAGRRRGRRSRCTGLLDVTANALYLLAAGTGLLSVVAVLGLALPGEHGAVGDGDAEGAAVASPDSLGLALAGIAVALIALGILSRSTRSSDLPMDGLGPARSRSS